MLKRMLTLVTALVTFSALAENTSFNDVDDTTAQQIRNELVKSLASPEAVEANLFRVEGIKQVGKSNVYMLTVFQGNQNYGMTYLKEINSIILHSSGVMLELGTQQRLPQDYAAMMVKPKLKEINDHDVITFSSSVPDAQEVYVFTDHTCPYCRRLHEEMQDYLKAGITVHYLPFPRGGEGSQAFEDLVHAYCSEDRKAAFSSLKKNPNNKLATPNKSYEALAQCESLVKKYYYLGQEMGVTGTPAIFDKEGYQRGGYVPALQLKQLMTQ